MAHNAEKREPRRKPKPLSTASLLYLWKGFYVIDMTTRFQCLLPGFPGTGIPGNQGKIPVPISREIRRDSREYLGFNKVDYLCHIHRQILISHVLWVSLVWTVVNTVAICFLFMVNILLFVITVTCHYTHNVQLFAEHHPRSSFKVGTCIFIASFSLVLYSGRVMHIFLRNLYLRHIIIHADFRQNGV